MTYAQDHINDQWFGAFRNEDDAFQRMVRFLHSVGEIETAEMHEWLNAPDRITAIRHFQESFEMSFVDLTPGPQGDVMSVDADGQTGDR